MDKKFNFIQLPKSEVMLAEEEQSYLLGGANCRPYTSCPKEYLNHCYYDNSPCATTAASVTTSQLLYNPRKPILSISLPDEDLV